MKLSIHLENPFRGTVVAGESISGTLVIDNGRRPCPVKRIALYFRGKEYTRVEIRTPIQRGDGSLEYSYDYVSQKNQLLRLDVPIPYKVRKSIICDGQVRPFQFSVVPFSFQVPSHIPSTVLLGSQDSCGSQAYIAYALRCQLVGSGYLWNYQAKVDIKILAAPKILKTLPFSTRIQRYKLLRGKTRVTCLSIHLAPLHRPQIMISFGSDAQCRRRHPVLRTIKLSVRQLSHWSAGRHYDDVMVKDLCTKTFHQVGPLNQPSTNFFELPPIPSSSAITSEGPLIQTSHYIKVKIVTKSGSTVDRCKVFIIPITIAPTGSTIVAHPQPPRIRSASMEAIADSCSSETEFTPLVPKTLPPLTNERHLPPSSALSLLSPAKSSFGQLGPFRHVILFDFPCPFIPTLLDVIPLLVLCYALSRLALGWDPMASITSE